MQCRWLLVLHQTALSIKALSPYRSVPALIVKQLKGTNVAWERCYATLPWYVYRINSKMRALKRGQKVRQKRKLHASEAFFNKCRTKILTLTRSLKSGQGSDRREKNSK